MVDGYQIKKYSKSYQDAVDALRRTFDKLELVVEGTPCVHLSDPVFKEWALGVWDADGDGWISEEEGRVTNGGRVSINFSTSPCLAEVLDFRNLKTGYVLQGTAANVPNARIVRVGPRAVRESVGYGETLVINNTVLEEYYMGGDEENIPQYAFEGCTSLRVFRFSGKITSIDGRAFMGCTALEDINEIPDTCTQIYGRYNQRTFEGCTSLRSITIGRGIQNIGNRTFYDCTAMESCYIKAATPPVLGSLAFGGTNLCTIYVPSGCGDAYKAASGWSTYADRISEYDFDE